MYKRILSIVLLVSFLLAGAKQMYAFLEKGDTLVIEQSDVMGTISFDDIIRADTLENGERAHTVYQLVENSIYELKASLDYTGYHLHLVGPEKRTDTEAWRPVILYSQGFEGWYGLEGGSLTLKHIHWEQIENREDGGITPWARAGINILETGAEIILQDMIWDFNTGFLLSGRRNGIKLKVTHCLFRFNKALQNSLWTGQGFDLQEVSLDTILFRDCTWYGGGAFLVSTWQSTHTLFRMDHCTVADFVQFPLHGKQWDNTYFTNNLFYNAHTLGEDFNLRHTPEPDTLPYGIINIDTVYIDEYHKVNWEAEADRVVHIKNNNNFVSPHIKSYWTEARNDTGYNAFMVADPAFYDGFMNSRTRMMFADDQNYPHLILESTSSLDPQFTDYFDYSDTLINYSKFYYNYANPEAVATTFMKDPDGDPLTPTDPMIYNLKITNPSLRTAAVDGGVVGDRTWELSNGYNNPGINETITGFEQDNPDRNSQFTDFVLIQNYPNPFNPGTTINFSIPSSAKVKIDIYNVLGKHIDTIVDSKLSAGIHEVTWPLIKHQYTSGIYFYKIQAGECIKINRMLLLK